MNTLDWILLGAFVTALAVLTRPMGAYLTHVLEPRGRTGLEPLVGGIERWTYRLLRIDPDVEQGWKAYAGSLLTFSFVSAGLTFLLLRFQHLLPLNPSGLPGLNADLAFNTAVSFMTNTNWQAYAGESTMSHLSQMVALTFHNFASAAAGIAVAAALVRGLSRSASPTLGNFWVDLIRITYHLLLPLSVVFALFLVSRGVIQNFDGPRTATALDPAVTNRVVIPGGPVASQVAIKMLGTNGGGFFNANAAHPFENPDPLSNWVQMLSIFLIGSGLTHYLGRATRNPGHGWSVWGAMMLLFVAGVWACTTAESAGNPLHTPLGIVATDGHMEGKEVRFGIFGSALFACITSAASCGAVNAMHDSFSPLGGLVPLFNIELGEVIVGGVGAGLYGMLLFVLLAVFIAGLLVGRTPEYLGRRIEAREVKLAMIPLLASCAAILGFAAVAVVSPWGLAGLNNSGPHGLSEILYAFSSAVGNNGSAFAGLSVNTPAYNLTLAAAMLIGRFAVILPVLALAGSMGAKNPAPAGAGTFPVSGPTFILLLVGTVLLVGALNFLPVLSLGPVVEHFLRPLGRTF